MTEVFAIGPTVFVKEFGEQVCQMYVSEHRRDDGRIPLNMSRGWLGFFFAIFALTAQCIQDDTILQHYSREEGPTLQIAQDFTESAKHFLIPVRLTERNTLDNVHGALALSMYDNQLNEINAVNIWLRLACKVTQNLSTSEKVQF